MNLARMLIVALTISLTSTNHLVADFVVDSWEATQSVSVDGVIIGSAGGTTTGAGIFGDGRGYSLQTLAAGESMTVASNRLTLSVTPLGPTYEGKFLLNYVDATPSVVINSANENGLVFSDIISNTAWKVSINFVGTPGSAIASYSTTIPASNNSNLVIPFGAFGGTSVNSLGALSEIAFTFTVDSTIAPGPGVFPQLSMKQVFATAVPEPSSILLASLAMTALVARHRRR